MYIVTEHKTFTCKVKIQTKKFDVVNEKFFLRQDRAWYYLIFIFRIAKKWMANTTEKKIVHKNWLKTKIVHYWNKIFLFWLSNRPDLFLAAIHLENIVSLPLVIYWNINIYLYIYNYLSIYIIINIKKDKIN